LLLHEKGGLLAKPPEDDAVVAAQAHARRVAAELNAQHQELRDQAQALLAAVKGRRGVYRDEDWQRIFQQANINYESGHFLIQQLGAERYLEPELMATLAQLRRGLLVGIQNPTAADTMMADSAVLAYHNMLRVQGWIGNLCLVVESELFGQEPLNKYHGPTVGPKLVENLRKLEEHLLLLERCHCMMAKSIAHLETRRGKPSSLATVMVGQAGQVNVDCSVMNGALGE
jgi:hypothetical protein